MMDTFGIISCFGVSLKSVRNGVQTTLAGAGIYRWNV